LSEKHSGEEFTSGSTGRSDPHWQEEMNQFALILLAIFMFRGFDKPATRPVPQPTPIVIATPTPEPSTKPTAAHTATPTPSSSPSSEALAPKPYPAPVYNPESFIRWPEGAKVVTVRAKKGEDLAALIQLAETAGISRPSDWPRKDVPITIRVEGGGSIKSIVRLRHHTVFDSSTYSCDVSGYRCFTVDNGVLVEGAWRPPPELDRFFKAPSFTTLKDVQALTTAQMAGTGTTILEPEFCNRGVPAITVFESYEDSISQQHERESRNITIMGIHVKGRQKCADGGMRQTMTFGNCVGCAAILNYLENTGSIGIQFGGYGEKGFRARDFLAWRNVTTGLPSAHFAVVNGEDGIIAENYSFRFGKVGIGGGVSGFDAESNSSVDYLHRLWVMNNVYDYEGSAFQSVGSAIVLQDPGFSPEKNGDLFAVNNWIIGGRRDNGPVYMSSCFIVATLNRVTLAGNYCFKTAQAGIQWYGKEGMRGQGSVIQDDIFDSTGGGGGPTIFFRDTEGITVKRNAFAKAADIKFNTDFRMFDCGGKNNIASDNLFNGKDTIGLTMEGCPSTGNVKGPDKAAIKKKAR
jgi:hypothetical protein